jgi:hypothetical protein
MILQFQWDRSLSRMNPHLPNILMADQKISEDVRRAMGVNRQHSKQQEVDAPQ